MLDATLGILRSAGLFTVDESEWFQCLFGWDNEELVRNKCILLTDGGGNAKITDLLALLNRMHLVRNYAKENPDEPEISSMDSIYWIMIAKRVDFRLCLMMLYTSFAAATFWEYIFTWSIPMRDPAATFKGLNTDDYCIGKALLVDTEVLSVGAWNAHVDPKLDDHVRKVVRRLRTGIPVPGNHLNLHAPPLLHFGDLGQAIDAMNPCRQGVEVDCCLRCMLQPGIPKMTST